ncbi:helix-turn-helix domain-containing protein [Solidesulfovibrio aerotolerans]
MPEGVAQRNIKSVLYHSRFDWSISRAGLSQEEVAQHMHTKQTVIARLESGRVMPSTRTLQRFAIATGTKLKISFDPGPTI